MGTSRHARGNGQIGSTKKHRIWPWILGIFIILIALAAVGGIFGYKFYTEAKEVKAHEEKALGLMSGFSDLSSADSLNTIAQKLPEIQQETSSAKAIAHGSLWNVAAKVPKIGDDVTTVQGMTTAVDSIVTDSVPGFVNAVSGLQSAQLTTGDGQLNIQPILDAQQSIAAANTSLQNNITAFNDLPEPHIGMVKNAYTNAKTKLNSAATTIDSLSKTINILPDFLGSSQPRTYLVMAMTTSEARSSGGLIGSVGTMTTDNGKISIGDFRSNKEYIQYGAGDPTEDESRIFTSTGPLQMSFDVRDLAAYPDTSRTAEGMRAIWQRTPWGSAQQVDGVILLDPVFLQELIKISGNVTLTNGQVLTGDNTAEFLLNTVYKDYSPTEQDVYFGEVAAQSVGTMFSNMDMNKLGQTANAMGSMAQGRHFSMYSFDENIEKTVSDAGFTAHTPSSEKHPKIGVYVTEQNASKMDWYIHRTSKITRSSCNTDGSQTYHVEYTLTNTLTSGEAASLPAYIIGVKQANMPQAHGVEKVLIYPPAGGSIANLQTVGTVTQTRDETLNGKAIKASLANLAPGASATYSFDVTTSSKSITDLAVDQTPMGWTDSGVTMDTQACTIGK